MLFLLLLLSVPGSLFDGVNCIDARVEVSDDGFWAWSTNTFGPVLQYDVYGRASSDPVLLATGTGRPHVAHNVLFTGLHKFSRIGDKIQHDELSVSFGDGIMDVSPDMNWALFAETPQASGRRVYLAARSHKLSEVLNIMSLDDSDGPVYIANDGSICQFDQKSLSLICQGVGNGAVANFTLPELPNNYRIADPSFVSVVQSSFGLRLAAFLAPMETGWPALMLYPDGTTFFVDQRTEPLQKNALYFFSGNTVFNVSGLTYSEQPHMPYLNALAVPNFRFSSVSARGRTSSFHRKSFRTRVDGCFPTEYVFVPTVDASAPCANNSVPCANTSAPCIPGKPSEPATPASHCHHVSKAALIAYGVTAGVLTFFGFLFVLRTVCKCRMQRTDPNYVSLVDQPGV